MLFLTNQNSTTLDRSIELMVVHGNQPRTDKVSLPEATHVIWAQKGMYLFDGCRGVTASRPSAAFCTNQNNTLDHFIELMYGFGNQPQTYTFLNLPKVTLVLLQYSCCFEEHKATSLEAACCKRYRLFPMELVILYQGPIFSLSPSVRLATVVR